MRVSRAQSSSNSRRTRRGTTASASPGSTRAMAIRASRWTNSPSTTRRDVGSTSTTPTRGRTLPPPPSTSVPSPASSAGITARAGGARPPQASWTERRQRPTSVAARSTTATGPSASSCVSQTTPRLSRATISRLAAMMSGTTITINAALPHRGRWRRAKMARPGRCSTRRPTPPTQSSPTTHGSTAAT